MKAINFFPELVSAAGGSVHLQYIVNFVVVMSVPIIVILFVLVAGLVDKKTRR